MAATLDLVKRRLADAPRSGDTRSPHSAARRRSTPMRRRAWRIASLAAC
ncbi:ABC transporter permease, partial [Burkholderia cenocepacia]|nr:ABC transporter permease [Burkholderia cenocepacia]